MTSRISHTSFNTRDSYAQSVFWSQVLGMSQDPADPNHADDEECMIFSADGRTRLLFIEVPDDKQLRNRIHLDLAPTDLTREAEIERVLELGATEVDDLRHDDGTGWMVLADPEGNEFCILRGEQDRPDPSAHLIKG